MKDPKVLDLFMEGVLQIVVSPCAYTFAVHVYICHSGAANIYYNPRFAMRVHPPVPASGV